MSDTTRPTIANATDYAAVCVCFQDDLINYLFADLLEVHGVKARILSDIKECRGDVRVITEPQYYGSLPPDYQRSCLVVGSKDVLKGIDALTLSRPLTEEKIENALSRFLSTISTTFAE